MGICSSTCHHPTPASSSLFRVSRGILLFSQSLDCYLSHTQSIASNSQSRRSIKSKWLTYPLYLFLEYLHIKKLSGVCMSTSSKHLIHVLLLCRTKRAHILFLGKSELSSCLDWSTSQLMTQISPRGNRNRIEWLQQIGRLPTEPNILTPHAAHRATTSNLMQLSDT